jgi:AraC-like DNA-binding protein
MGDSLWWRVAAAEVLTNRIPAFAAPPALSNNTPMNVRKKTQPTDPRVLRSRRALGDALVELLHEQRFDDITVQDILDRAGVGRATFYAHYRNKEDVLHSGVEQLFVLLGAVLDRSSPAGTRIVPVSEFLEHVREADVFIASLRASGKLDEISELIVAFVADMISRRLLRERFREEGLPAPTRAAEPTPVRSELEERLRAIVEANLLEPDFNPDALATAAGLSYQTLYRRLRDEVEATPSQLIRTVRVERAADLLRDGAGNVTEVAYSVGFNSLSHFHRSYRERFGASPTANLKRAPT